MKYWIFMPDPGGSKPHSRPPSRTRAVTVSTWPFDVYARKSYSFVRAFQDTTANA
jgi:hypothetical protein